MNKAGIFIKKEFGSKVIQLFNDAKLLDHQFQITKTSTDLGLPVTDIAVASSLLSAANISFNVRLSTFTARQVRPRSIQESLYSYIPAELHSEIPSSFDAIGTVAVIDIKPSMLPYKHDIARAILQVSSTIQSVYRKSHAVSGSHRLRALEHIGGIANTETVHTEYGIRIALDIAKVYFSPRLSTEHHRIAQFVQPHEVVLDLFTASGAFPLHITHTVPAHVVAVDINPDAIYYLQQSIQLNKLKGIVEAVCTDAHNFSPQHLFSRILMNHPSGAKSFLKHADSMLESGGILHYYSFVAIDNFEDTFMHEFESELSGYEYLHFRKIRQYSPELVHAVLDAKKA